jgi:hypothetical protein
MNSANSTGWIIQVQKQTKLFGVLSEEKVIEQCQVDRRYEVLEPLPYFGADSAVYDVSAILPKLDPLLDVANSYFFYYCNARWQSLEEKSLLQRLKVFDYRIYDAISRTKKADIMDAQIRKVYLTWNRLNNML